MKSHIIEPTIFFPMPRYQPSSQKCIGIPRNPILRRKKNYPGLETFSIDRYSRHLLAASRRMPLKKRCKVRDRAANEESGADGKAAADERLRVRFKKAEDNGVTPPRHREI